MTKSTYLKHKQLNAEFNNTAWNLGVADVFMSLHSADPGATGASEVAGGSYARQATSFGAASGGAVANDTEESFTMPAVTVTHIGFWDAVSGGNYLRGGAVTSSKTFTLGEIARVAIAGVTVSET